LKYVIAGLTRNLEYPQVGRNAEMPDQVRYDGIKLINSSKNHEPQQSEVDFRKQGVNDAQSWQARRG